MGLSTDTDRAGRGAYQGTFDNLPAVAANWGGPGSLEVSKRDSNLQEGHERGSRELRPACLTTVSRKGI